MREFIYMTCSDCKRRNYISTRNKKKHPEKVSLNKYCRFCRKHTLHKESK